MFIISLCLSLQQMSLISNSTCKFCHLYGIWDTELIVSPADRFACLNLLPFSHVHNCNKHAHAVQLLDTAASSPPRSQPPSALLSPLLAHTIETNHNCFLLFKQMWTGGVWSSPNVTKPLQKQSEWNLPEHVTSTAQWRLATFRFFAIVGTVKLVVWLESGILWAAPTTNQVCNRSPLSKQY